MKIIALHPYLYGKGGGERHASKICQHLKSIGHDVVVYGTWEGDKVGVPEWWEGLELHKIWEHIKLPVLRRTFSALAIMFRDFNSDILAEADLFIGFGPHGAIVAGRCSNRIPTIAYFFHPWYLLYSRSIDREKMSFLRKLVFRNPIISYPIKWIDKRTVRKATSFAANSPIIENLVKKIYDVECLSMMPGADYQTVTNTLSTEFGSFVFIPTRIAWHKNIIVGLKAIKILQESGYDVSLVYCGAIDDVWYKEQLDEYVKQNSLEKKVHYLGFVDDAKLKSLYRSAICHWFTAKVEDFGLTPVEAKWQMCPTVGANDGGGVYTIRDKIDGFLVNPDSPEEFAESTKKLLNQDLRKVMGEEARKDADTRWMWERHFKEWDQLIEKTITEWKENSGKK